MANAHDLLMAQRAAMMGGKPYLRRVAYLESDGKQFINTQIDCSTLDYSFSWIMANNSFGIWGWVFSLSADDTWISVVNKEVFYNGYNNHLIYSDDVSNKRITYDMRSGIFINDYLVRSFISAAPTTLLGHPLAIGNVYDFKFNTYDMLVEGTNRYCDFIIRRNGGIVCKFIPVLDLSGRPAMYDKVSGQFFYNQGTGEFTWGELET